MNIYVLMKEPLILKKRFRFPAEKSMRTVQNLSSILMMNMRLKKPFKYAMQMAAK